MCWRQRKNASRLVSFTRFPAPVEHINLFRADVLLQQLRRDLLFRSQHDAVRRQDAQRGAGVRDGLHRVLDLVKSACPEKDALPRVSEPRSRASADQIAMNSHPLEKRSLSGSRIAAPFWCSVYEVAWRVIDMALARAGGGQLLSLPVTSFVPCPHKTMRIEQDVKVRDIFAYIHSFRRH